MFSVIKGSETDLQANEIQLAWMKTLIYKPVLQLCGFIHKQIFQITTCKHSNISRPSIKWYEPLSLLAEVGL